MHSWLISTFIALLGFSALAVADEFSVNIVRVEEHWELSVGEPNQAVNAPQVSMVVSPHSNSDYEHFVYEMNFKSLPSYSPGGMQIQYWTCWGNADTRQGGPSTASQLDVSNDTVTWRQAMSLSNGVLRFEVEDGSSGSWGNFGGQGYLRLDVNTSLANLNKYSVRNSLEESGISFAGNRVDSLTLTKVKWYAADGQTWVLEAPFDIDNDLDPWD